MRSKAYAIVAFCILLTLAAVYFYRSYQGYKDLFDPYYRGRRVHDWADTAIDDSDPSKRREATEALVEAFKEMHPGGPRIQLVMRFCDAKLPKEVLPFLIEALHAPEMPPKGYPSIALRWVDPDVAIPALIHVILHDKDEHACECAASALFGLGPEAAVSFHEALVDCPEDRRKLALDSFK